VNGGDVDDFAPAAGDHRAGNRLADVEDARDVGGQELLPLIDGEVLERRAKLHPGIVDEDIDRPIGESRRDAGCRVLRLGDVERSLCDPVSAAGEPLRRS